MNVTSVNVRTTWKALHKKEFSFTCNKAFVFEVLTKLGKLYGFRFCEGLKDRVIYKELFLDGLTVLDMQHEQLRRKMNMSHLAAKIEIKNLAEFICP